MVTDTGKETNKDKQMTKSEIPTYIRDIKKSLTERYGKVRPAWIPMIDMLEDNLYIYQDIRERIKDNGVAAPDAKHTNADIKALGQVAATIFKISTKLGVSSPYDQRRIGEEKNEEEEDYLSTL